MQEPVCTSHNLKRTGLISDSILDISLLVSLALMASMATMAYDGCLASDGLDGANGFVDLDDFNESTRRH